MLDPILKLVFSVTFLRGRVPPNQAFAAGAAAALIPGPLGLAVPLLVAPRVGPIGVGVVSNVPVVPPVAVVPPVIGMSKLDAEDAIRRNKLKPVSKSVEIEGGKDEDKGNVVDQVPEPGKLVDLGTKVTLTVSLGPPEPAPEDEDLVLDREIKKNVQEGFVGAQAQLNSAKAEILTAIAAKKTPYGGGSPTGSPPTS